MWIISWLAAAYSGVYKLQERYGAWFLNELPKLDC